MTKWSFWKRAPAHLHLALMIGLWTGQRQGDLLRLPWSSYDGKHIRLRQSKGGRRIVVPVGEPLKIRLDATPKRSTIILTNREASRGRRTASGHRGARRARLPASWELRSTICGVRP